MRAAHALDGHHVPTVGCRRRHQAGHYGHPIHMHRASAALTFATTLLGAAQAKILAQHVQQCLGVGAPDGIGPAVDCQLDRLAPINAVHPTCPSRPRLFLRAGEYGGQQDRLLGPVAALAAGAQLTQGAFGQYVDHIGPVSTGAADVVDGPHRCGGQPAGLADRRLV